MSVLPVGPLPLSGWSGHFTGGGPAEIRQPAGVVSEIDGLRGCTRTSAVEIDCSARYTYAGTMSRPPSKADHELSQRLAACDVELSPDRVQTFREVGLLPRPDPEF